MMFVGTLNVTFIFYTVVDILSMNLFSVHNNVE